MKIVETKRFSKQLKKLPQEVKNKYRDRLLLFLSEPMHPVSRVHSLKSGLAYLSSFNVTGDYHVWFSQSTSDQKTILELVAIGTHSELYG